MTAKCPQRIVSKRYFSPSEATLLLDNSICGNTRDLKIGLIYFQTLVECLLDMRYSFILFFNWGKRWSYYYPMAVFLEFSRLMHQGPKCTVIGEDSEVFWELGSTKNLLTDFLCLSSCLCLIALSDRNTFLPSPLSNLTGDNFITLSFPFAAFMIVSSHSYSLIQKFQQAQRCFWPTETDDTLLTSKEFVFRVVCFVDRECLEEIFILLIYMKFLRLQGFVRECLVCFIMFNTLFTFIEIPCSLYSFYMLPNLLNTNNLSLNLSTKGIQEWSFFLKLSRLSLNRQLYAAFETISWFSLFFCCSQ